MKIIYISVINRLTSYWETNNHSSSVFDCLERCELSNVFLLISSIKHKVYFNYNGQPNRNFISSKNQNNRFH